MARDASVAKAGYFPLDESGFDDLGAVLRLEPATSKSDASGHVGMLDPCAGKGESLRLAYALAERYVEDALGNGRGSHYYAREHVRGVGVDLRMCELEVARAAEASRTSDRLRDAATMQRLRGYDHGRVPVSALVAPGDAFCLPVPCVDATSYGPVKPWARILYLNPPYDRDDAVRGGRLEERWLDRFSYFVSAGGVLAYVVPLAAVAASADTLARRWTDVQVGRVRAGSASAAFASTQVVVLARRLSPDLAVSDPTTAARLRALAAGGVDALPQVRDLTPMEVGPASEYPPAPHTWKVYPLDYGVAAAEHVPWHRSVRRAVPGSKRRVPLAPLREALPAGRPWAELTAREYPTLMPLKPSYLADAIASGALDGELLEPGHGGDAAPDADATLPAVYVKGMFNRRFREVEVKYDSKGDPRTSVQVQRPALRVSVLDPTAGAVYVLGDSALPSGSRELAGFTVGDLVQRYGASLAAALGRRCPVVCAEETAAVVVPSLRRVLYPAQAAAVRAAAGRLLRQSRARAAVGGRGATPAVLLQGQPGTGKTSMCLAIARTVGARRVLVVCPPHLVAEEAAWQSDAVSVLGTGPVPGRPELGPGCEVRVLETPADVDRFVADGASGEPRILVGLASREVAKLGHGYEGVWRCARCGTVDPRDPLKLASTRATCKAPALRAASGSASSRRGLRAAMVAAARALAWCEPESPEVGECLPAGSSAHRARARLAQRPVAARPAGVVVEAAREAVARVKRWTAETAASTMNAAMKSLYTRLCDDVAAVASALGPSARVSTSAARAARGPTLRLLQALRSACPLVAAGAPRRGKGGEGWVRGVECGEPLWQASARPRRWPLVRSLVDAARRGAFDLVVLDEAHEYGNYDSAQAQAAERLVSTGVPIVLATGTVCNGYMSSLHAQFRVLSTEYARDFARDERPRAVARFGYQRRAVDLASGAAPAAGGDDQLVELGAVSDRVVKGGVRVIGQAPGVLPEALLRYLAPATAQVHLEDLGESLPPLREDLVSVAPTDVQRAGLRYLSDALCARIRADRKDPARAGKLFGQFAELPSFLDRCSLRPEWVASYPPESVAARKRGERGEVVASLPAHGDAGTIELPPAGEVLPKERALVEWVAAQLRRGRPCLVYVWHWDLMPRIAAALRAGLASFDDGYGPGRWAPGDATGAFPESHRGDHVPARVDVLDPGKVPPVKREAWISKSAASRCAVLLTNPAAVKTGINSLARWWCSAGWYEGPGSSPEIRRQATHRLWRIGQTRPVEVASFVYGETMQQQLHELLLHKVGVSEAVDGLDATAALTAAGVGEGDALASLEVGRALFEWCERGEGRSW